jgi:Zn-dependent peptidase ImmA (M78 family)
MALGFLSARGHFFSGSKLLVEELIEDLGFEIYPVKGLSRYAEGFLPRKGKRIYVDEDQMLTFEPRYRFTLAEELAHFLLIESIFPGKTEDQIAKEIDAFSDPEYGDFERNAKYLAGALLMPQVRFSERYKVLEGVFSERSTSKPYVIRAVLQSLSKEFCVSHESAGIRANMLDLIRQEDLGGT